MESKNNIFQIVGNTFLHLSGGNKGFSVHGKQSRYINWSTNPCDVVFYVDNEAIKGLSNTSDQKKYAWLLESRGIVPGLLEHILSNTQAYLDTYEMIFTHDQTLLSIDSKFKWVPGQGFWIKNPMVYQKHKLVSMISSSKSMLEGHRQRLAFVEKFKDHVDLYGRGFNEIDNKEQGLCDYMFSVAIENDQYPTYFTEKILDCFATGTIPVYLGAPDIGGHFNLDAILTVDQFDLVDKTYYYDNMDAIIDNLERAKKMEVLEDFIYENYLLGS